MGFSTDGKLVWAGNRAVWLSDIDSGKNLAKFTNKNELVSRAAISQDGKTIAASFGTCREILLFDTGSAEIRRKLPHDRPCHSFSFSPDGNKLVSCERNLVHVWDVETGKELRQMQFGTDKKPVRIHQIAISPDGKTVAVGLEPQIVLSPDGKVIERERESGIVVLRAIDTGKEIRQFSHKENQQQQIGGLAFSPDGKYLAFTGEANGFVIWMWEVGEGRLAREFRLPWPTSIDAEKALPRRERRYGSWGCSWLAFSPDGKTLAAAWGETQLWEVSTGRLRLQFPAQTTYLAFAPNGRVLAGNTDPRPTIWAWREPDLKRTGRLSSKEAERLWTDLASDDAAVGYRAIAALIDSPKEAVELLGEKLHPVEAVTSGQLARLMTDLDDDSASVRDRAFHRLAALNEAARPALMNSLTKPPSEEVRVRLKKLLQALDGPLTSERLRSVRSVEILEVIRTELARRVLQKLADGADGATESESARGALKRLEQAH
jgi:WD40 repeat protein